MSAERGQCLLMVEQLGYSVRLLLTANGKYCVVYSDGIIRETAVFSSQEKALDWYDKESERLDAEIRHELAHGRLHEYEQESTSSR
jgi:hypothetical protein